MAPGGLTITFAVAPGFATLAAGEYIPIALSENGTREVVHLTAYTAGALTGTIERAQEGSAAGTFTTAGKWVHGPTVRDIMDRFTSPNGREWDLDLDDAGRPSFSQVPLTTAGVREVSTANHNTAATAAPIPASAVVGDGFIIITRDDSDTVVDGGDLISREVAYSTRTLSVWLKTLTSDDITTGSIALGVSVTFITYTIMGAATVVATTTTSGGNVSAPVAFAAAGSAGLTILGVGSGNPIGDLTYPANFTDVGPATNGQVDTAYGSPVDAFAGYTAPESITGWASATLVVTTAANLLEFTAAKTSDTAPVALGAAAPGTAADAARADHVHPATGLATDGHIHDPNLLVKDAAPDAAVGAVGDYWLNQATRRLYGPKFLDTGALIGNGEPGGGAQSNKASQARRFESTAPIDVARVGIAIASEDYTADREIRYLITSSDLATTLAETPWTDIRTLTERDGFLFIDLASAYTIPTGTIFWIVIQQRTGAGAVSADVTTVATSADTAYGSVREVADAVQDYRGWDGHDLTVAPVHELEGWYGAHRLEGVGTPTWPATEEYTLASVQPADHPFFVAGTIGAGESLVSGWEIHDAVTQTLVRVIAYLRDTPTGANATNHAKLVVSDGTTSVDVPLSSDVVKHAADIALARVTEITQAGAVATTSLMEGRATPFVPDANESIDIIGIRLSNPSAAAANVELAILSSTRTILGSVTVSVPANSVMSEVIGTLATPVALTAGTTYHLAYRADIDISHDVSSTAAWTGAAGGGASHYYTTAPVDFATSQGTETYYLIGALYSRDATPTFGPELSVRVVAVGNPPPDAGGDLNLIVTTEAVQ